MTRLTRPLALAAAVSCALAALSGAREAAAGGYAHSFIWYQKPDAAAAKACVADMARVLAAAKDRIAGPDGTGAPVVAADKVHFNGRGDDAEEAFLFPGKPDRNECRTMREPYDAAVTACLLVARDHFPPEVLGIESDGRWSDGDWDKGRRLYQQIFGRRALDPLTQSDAEAPDAPAPGIGAAGQPEEWTPLSIIVVVGIFGALVWMFVRPHSAFVITVEGSRIDRVRGDAPRPFLMDVDDICRDFTIARATIREIRVLRAGLLHFSAGIPRECRQKIRNTWRMHL